MPTLLQDALQRARQDSACARRWHRLMSVWLEAPSAEARQAVIEELKATAQAEPRADILRLTFLAGATGDSAFENAAAARVLADGGDEADRLAAFMAFRWLSALQELGNRDRFVSSLSGGQVPEMAVRLAREAARYRPAGMLPRAPAELRRVAVVVPHMANRFHTPGMMAVEQCAVLAGAGLQVRLFSAQELTPPDAALFRGDGRELVLPQFNPKELAGLLPGDVGLAVVDERFSLPGRWQNLMPAIAQFDPDLVLLVGLYSPLAAALHAVRPVAGLSVNTVAPIAPLDIWLAGDAQHDASTWSEWFPAAQTIPYPFRIARRKATGSLTREQLGVDKDAVVWITAGFRLEQEIGGEWARRMMETMARYPEAVWLLVGGAGRLPKALQRASPQRVRTLPTRDDMVDLLRLSDIYVNPPRMGGGFSVAEAMAEGLPVTAMSGSDGGDKTGEFALAGIDAYIERLAALTERCALRDEVGQALRRRFARHYDTAAAGPALLAALTQAATLAAERFRKAS